MIVHYVIVAAVVLAGWFAACVVVALWAAPLIASRLRPRA